MTTKADIQKAADGVAAAEAEVERLTQTVARWEAESAAKSAELADLELRAGEEVLADESAAVRLSTKMAELRAGVQIAHSAAEAASRRLADARRAVFGAQAAELRARAADLRRQVAERRPKTAALLAELREFEGVEFAVAAVPPEFTGPHTPFMVVAPLTTSQRMLNEATSLDGQAAQLEARSVVRYAEPFGTLSTTLRNSGTRMGVARFDLSLTDGEITAPVRFDLVNGDQVVHSVSLPTDAGRRSMWGEHDVNTALSTEVRVGDRVVASCEAIERAEV